MKAKGGLKAGDGINEVWKRDRDSFFNDQQNNGMRELNCIYVYILSNNMLNLPVNKVLVRSPLMGSCICCLSPTILYFLEYYRAIIYFYLHQKSPERAESWE